MTAYAAHLRVYEPLHAFDDEERARWASYVRSGSAPTPGAGTQLERLAALAAVSGPVPAVLPDVSEHAFVLDADGLALVCPWRTLLRSREALSDLRLELPEVLVTAALPAEVADAADRALHQERTEHPGRRSHILTSTWQVPIRWFVLFDPAEREVRTGRRLPGGAPAGSLPAGGAPGPRRPDTPAGPRAGRSLVYRTQMSRARRRVARGLAVLRRTRDQEGATDHVEDLGRWLEEFHPRSTVELDYGGLVHLQDDNALEQDESARDVAIALAALGEGRTERAAAAYSRVAERMKALQAVESAN